MLESDPVVQEKWFSTRGSFAPRGHSCRGGGHFLLSQLGRELQVEAGVGVLLASSGRDHDVAKRAAVHGPATRNDPGQAALSAEGERPGHRVALECLPEPSPRLHTKPHRK